MAEDPDSAEASVRRAHALQAAGDMRGAETVWRAVLARDADHVEALNDLASLVAARGALDEAGGLLARAVVRRPDMAQLQSNLANVLRRLGRPADARPHAEAAVRLAPDSVEAHWILGAVESALGDHDGAAATFARAAALRPDSAELNFAHGTALNRAGRGAEAVAPFERALALERDDPRIHLNLGIALRQTDRLKESLDRLDRAAELAQGDAVARWNRGLTHLALGHLHEGWTDYEARLQLRDASPDPALPVWNGRDRVRVLVRREQGLGDEVLFATCLPDAIATGAQLAVECDARLAPLFARSFPAARIVPVVRPRDGAPEPPAPDGGPADAWIAAGSLPRLFRPTLDSFPARARVLSPDPARRAFWRAWIEGLNARLAVGLCWRSSQPGGARDSRYANLDALAPLFAVPGVRLVSLQLGTTEAELAGGRLAVPPGLDLRDDIDGTAALCAALDAVIAVDSWVLILAGTVGAPAVFLATQRDWAALGTERVPWLASVRVRWVAPAGWAEAAEAVARELGTALAKR